MDTASAGCIITSVRVTGRYMARDFMARCSVAMHLVLGGAVLAVLPLHPAQVLARARAASPAAVTMVASLADGDDKAP